MNNKVFQLKESVKQADKIYIDTCSLMEGEIRSFLEMLFGFVQAQPKRPDVIVLQKVLDELDDVSRNMRKEERFRESAQRARDLVWECERNKQLIRYGSAQDVFADAKFLSEFSRVRLTDRILFITEDFKNLRVIDRALNQPDMQIAQRGYPIVFYSIRSGLVDVSKLKPLTEQTTTPAAYFASPAPSSRSNTVKGIVPNETMNNEKPKAADNSSKTASESTAQEVVGQTAQEAKAEVAQSIAEGKEPEKQTTDDKKPTKEKSVSKAKRPVTLPSKASAIDGDRSLSVELRKGDGIIKGVFKRSPKKFSFILNVEYSGDGKLSDLYAEVGPGPGYAPLVKKIKEGENELVVELDRICYPTVKVTVEAEVKIGFNRRKPFKVCVGKTF